MPGTGRRVGPSPDPLLTAKKNSVREDFSGLKKNRVQQQGFQGQEGELAPH
jgi:hypothetical protein